MSRVVRRAATSILALLLMLPLACTAARAPASRPASMLAPPFRAVIEQGVANHAYAGIAIGLIEGDRHETAYFGHRDNARGAAPDADSQFEIGAVSEVFAGLLLAQARLEGRLRLTDPIDKLLPQDFPFRDPATGRIALGALITQRSGLPPQPLNLFPRDLDDPFADYAAEDLLAYLAYRMPSAPTEVLPTYSVLNVGLLGHLLGRLYEAPYAEALQKTVLGPLGLAHTTFADSPALLAGYAGGEIATHWHYGVLAAAAGLRTTLPDLLAFLQHCLAPGDSPLRPALLLARQVRTPAADGAGETAIPDQDALGWNVREVEGPDGSWPLVWRASETAGFSVFVGFRTDKQKAIALLGNATSDLAELGMAWLNESTQLPEAPHGVSARRVASGLAEYPGLYELASGQEMVVRLRDNQLSLQLPGAWPQRLRAVERDAFASDEGNSGVSFMRDPDTVTGLVLHRDGAHVSARRLSLHAPRLARPVVKLLPAQLEELRGDWRIAPDLWLRIGVDGASLVLQPARAPRLTLQAYAPDRLADADGAVDVTVRRDARGRIAQLALDLAGAQRIAKPLHPHANIAKP